MPVKNQEQDIRLTKIEIKEEERWASWHLLWQHFLDNDFKHLKEQQDKTFWTIVIGIGISVLTILASKFLI